MEKQKIDLKNMNEQEWEKYRKMHKVASRPTSIISPIFYYALVIVLIFVMGYYIVQISAVSISLLNMANYSANQFNASLPSSIALMLNINNSKNLNNNTVNALMGILQKSPKASATLAGTNFFLELYSIDIIFILFGAIGLIVVCLVFFVWIPNPDNKFKLPTRFCILKNTIYYVQKRDKKLREYGFTEQEIAWYHAVRSELIKLEIEYRL
jgi:hypothetical protein